MSNVYPFDPARMVSERESAIVMPLETGGGPPHDGGMEVRIAKLEVAVDYIQRDVSEMRAALVKLGDSSAAMQGDMSAIRERMTHMPTKLAMWAAVGAVVVTVGGGLWWIVQQYLGPLLTRAAGG